MSAAERRDPSAFPVDDRRVYDAYVAGRSSAALAAAARLGLFDALDAAGTLSRDELCARLELSPRGARALLAALAATGLVEESGGCYSLAEDAALYLVRGKPGSLHGLVDLEVEHFLSPAALLDAVRTGRPSVYGGADPWEAHAADPAAAAAFTAAMHAVSERPAAGFAEVVDFSRTERVLDVGGGSGALSIAVARAWPHVRCVVWDLPVVCGLAREYAERAGVADRVGAEPGDMFAEPFPTGFDAVILSQILHDWSFDAGRSLLARAFAALPPGGRVLIHEKLVDDDGPGPLANALVHLDMLVWTEGQQYGEGELRELLGEAGFADVRRRATAGYWSVVEGRVPQR